MNSIPYTIQKPIVHHLIGLSFVILLLACPSQVRGQGDQEADDLAGWLHRAWNEAGQPLDLRDLVFRWTLERHEVPPQAELDRLRKEVARGLYHPLASMLTVYDRRYSGRTSTEVHELRYRGPGQFRFNVTVNVTGDENAVIDYWDIVVIDKYAWSLSPDQLAIIDHQAKGWPDDRNLGSLEPEIIRHVQLLLNGGMSLGRAFNLELGEPVRQDNQWQVKASSEGVEFTYDGVWDPDAGRGFVTRMTITKAETAPREVYTSWQVGRWTRDPELNRWVAAEVSEFEPCGRLDTVLRFGSAVRESPDTFERVTAIPSFESNHDYIRGELTFDSVFDYRTGNAELRDEQGFTRVIPDALN